MKYSIEGINTEGRVISQSSADDTDIGFIMQRVATLVTDTPTAVQFMVSIIREDPEVMLIKHKIKYVLKSTQGYSFEEISDVLFDELDIKLKEETK